MFWMCTITASYMFLIISVITRPSHLPSECLDMGTFTCGASIYVLIQVLTIERTTRFKMWLVGDYPPRKGKFKRRTAGGVLPCELIILPLIQTNNPLGRVPRV